MQSNAKVIEGARHPDRDAQFRYINTKVRAYLRHHDPVISVDTKKKELVGEFKNPGQAWHPTRAPTRVKVHDFKPGPDGLTGLPLNDLWVES